MFTLQIQCTTIEDAERVLAALKHTAEPAVVNQVAEQLTGGSVSPELNGESTSPQLVEKPKRGRPRREVAEKPAASTDATKATNADVNATDATKATNANATQQAPTFDQVRAALKAVQAKYGENDLAKPLAILQKFDAARVSAVKESDFPAFIAACEAA